LPSADSKAVGRRPWNHFLPHASLQRKADLVIEGEKKLAHFWNQLDAVRFQLVFYFKCNLNRLFKTCGNCSFEHLFLIGMVALIRADEFYSLVFS
jgi:hypothetical protein